MAWPRESRDGEADGALTIALHQECFLALFGVCREGAVGEAELVRFVDDVDDPAGCDRRDLRERDGQHNRLTLADRRLGWMNRQPGSSVRFPATKTVDRVPIRPLAGAEFDDMAIVPITLGEGPSGRSDLVIRHPLRRLFGEQPLKVAGHRPAQDKHGPTMPGRSGHAGRDERTKEPFLRCLAGTTALATVSNLRSSDPHLVGTSSAGAEPALTSLRKRNVLR